MAGAGKSGRQWTSFKALLNRDHVDFKEAFSEGPGHTYQLARQSAGDYEVLAAVGGDGTVREVVDGIMSANKTHVAVALVPFGTGNDLAQVLGVQTESDALRTFGAGALRSIDVIQITCQVEGKEVVRHALLFAGVGVIATALRKTTPSFKRVFGQRLAYPMGLIAALLDFRAPRMRVAVDGVMHEEDFLFVGASNTEIAGGGMRVAPGALIDDGVLNLNLIGAMSRCPALLQLRRLARGRHLGHPKVHYLATKSVQIDSRPPLEIAADGDIIGHTPAKIAVKPGALRVLVAPS